MANIKNDPNRYVKRASLSSHADRFGKGVKEVSSQEREKAFLAAHIDDRFYVDFSKLLPKGNRRKG
jgi:hypothetical protein